MKFIAQTSLHRSVFLAATLLLCGCDGRWEDYEKTTGYQGKARVNPFLAAERVLDGLGHNAHGVKSLAKLPPHDSVILISGENGLPEGRARQLLRWTYSGGHLIYCLGGTRAYNDFETQFGTFIAAMLKEEKKDPILQQLGISAEKRFPTEEIKEAFDDVFNLPPADPAKPASPKRRQMDDEDESKLESLQDLRWNGANYQLSLGGHQQLVIKRKLRNGEFSAGPKDGALALHLQHGMGSVTLLTHARPFRNHWIGEHDHARWLAALVGLNGSKEVLFVSGAAGSFLSLLWQHGWMALIALAVCLIFWLWQQLPRFGPLAEVELDTTRHFASHVGALGEFFWRMRRGALLVTAARAAVWERVREKHRSLDDGSHQMNDVLAAEIARRTGLPAPRITAAFDIAPPDTAHNFVALMRDLQAMRRAL